jgi:hypothetical protein
LAPQPILLLVLSVSLLPTPARSNPSHWSVVCCDTRTEKEELKMAHKVLDPENPEHRRLVPLHASAHLSQMITQTFCTNAGESLYNHGVQSCRRGRCRQKKRHQQVLVDGDDRRVHQVTILCISIFRPKSFFDKYEN